LPFVDFKKALLSQKLDYEDASFDVVFFLDVYEHLRDPLTILGEIHRILKKDGICVMTSPNIASIF
jgi:ubiquinone/menaquinone biosynthesis C-methylase UbiE